MASKRVISSGLGTRYGAKTRTKVEIIKNQYKKKNMKCPFTGKVGAVKRLSAGIFLSTATGQKFTARAYSTERTAKPEAE